MSIPFEKAHASALFQAGDAAGLQIIARSSMNLGLAAGLSGPPVMLHAKAVWHVLDLFGRKKKHETL